MSAQSRLDTIKEIIQRNDLPSYRFEQIILAIYKEGKKRYSEISILPKSLREQIINVLGDEILTLKNVAEIQGNQAHKILFETKTGQRIEAVRLSYHGPRYSLCLSTQSGCGLGCRFCATGAIGFKKNLLADEITDQLLYFIQEKMPIDSLIFMGMGEPFSNPQTFSSLADLTNPKLFGLSDRRISVSTVGIIPGIERLTQEYPEINLALSLHSPFESERQKLMPVSITYPIDSIFSALDQHHKETNRKVFLAYVLLNGVNDSDHHATALSQLISANPNRQRLLHVNLICYNPGPSLDSFEPSSLQTVKNFQNVLDKYHVQNTLRQDFGQDIAAACGQLYASYLS